MYPTGCKIGPVSLDAMIFILIFLQEGEEGSRPGTSAAQDTKVTSQKKKRGRPKSSKKTPEAENVTETSPAPKTPKRRVSSKLGTDCPVI